MLYKRGNHPHTLRLKIVRKLRIFKVYLINLQNPSHYVKRSCTLRGKQFFVIVNFKKCENFPFLLSTQINELILKSAEK